MKNARTRSREEVLKILYQLDVLKNTPDPAESRNFFTGKELKKEALCYAESLLEGCLKEKDKIDELITNGLDNWNLSHIASIDRCIMRIGVYEIVFREDVPAKVAINEAIELAKKYSTENSGAFVNGLLDNIRKQYSGG